MAGEDRTSRLKTTAYELVKQYITYDGSDRVEYVYTAHTDAAHGTPCTRTQYEYDRVGNVVTKVVTVVVADGEEGRVRTIVVPKGGHAAPLNVDVRPHVQSNGRILVRLALQYDLGRGPSEEAEEPPAPGAAPTVVIAPADRSSVNETVAVVLENGRPMIVTQSADAVTDRKVTVEVKATVLK